LTLRITDITNVESCASPITGSVPKVYVY